MRKNDAFVAKIVNTRLTKGFMAIFAPAESLPSPATLVTEEAHRAPNFLRAIECVQRIDAHPFYVRIMGDVLPVVLV